MNTNSKLRNLLISGINAAIDQNAIDINNLNDSEGHLTFELFGNPSKFSGLGINHEELRVTIWWGIKPKCIDETTTQPLNKNIGDALDACCSGWIERKTGTWLQGSEKWALLDYYCSRSARDELNYIPIVEPKGFNMTGEFFL